jgi:hypothetical protein
MPDEKQEDEPCPHTPNGMHTWYIVHVIGTPYSEEGASCRLCGAKKPPLPRDIRITEKFKRADE